MQDCNNVCDQMHFNRHPALLRKSFGTRSKVVYERPRATASAHPLFYLVDASLLSELCQGVTNRGVGEPNESLIRRVHTQDQEGCT
jgi:hypothetical protein